MLLILYKGEKTCNFLDFDEIFIMSFEKNEIMVIEKAKFIDIKLFISFRY